MCSNTFKDVREPYALYTENDTFMLFATRRSQRTQPSRFETTPTDTDCDCPTPVLDAARSTPCSSSSSTKPNPSSRTASSGERIKLCFFVIPFLAAARSKLGRDWSLGRRGVSGEFPASQYEKDPARKQEFVSFGCNTPCHCIIMPSFPCVHTEEERGTARRRERVVRLAEGDDFLLGVPQ
jgi:hypothetical protein